MQFLIETIMFEPSLSHLEQSHHLPRFEGQASYSLDLKTYNEGAMLRASDDE